MTSGKQILLSTILFAAALLAVFHVLDNKGQEYTDQAMKRALITFGVARGLNGVISVAQGTEIAIHPAGFGVNFAPGQILDPINDLIEQFSWVMLASSASLGIQKVLLGISSNPAVSGILVLVLAIYGVSLWKNQLFSPGLKRVLTSGMLFILFLRFSVPVVALANEAIYHYFLHDQYVEANEKLENTQKDITELSRNDNKQLINDDKKSLLEQAKQFFESASESLSVNARIDKYQKIAAEATEQAINLIVIFVIQTIIFPIIFLWCFYRGLRAAWSKMVSV